MKQNSETIERKKLTKEFERLHTALEHFRPQVPWSEDKENWPQQIVDRGRMLGMMLLPFFKAWCAPSNNLDLSYLPTSLRRKLYEKAQLRCTEFVQWLEELTSKKLNGMVIRYGSVDSRGRPEYDPYVLSRETLRRTFPSETLMLGYDDDPHYAFSFMNSLYNQFCNPLTYVIKRGKSKEDRWWQIAVKSNSSKNHPW